MKGTPLMMRHPVTAPVSVMMHFATTVPETFASSASREQTGCPPDPRAGRVIPSSKCMTPPGAAGAAVATAVAVGGGVAATALAVGATVAATAGDAEGVADGVAEGCPSAFAPAGCAGPP